MSRHIEKRRRKWYAVLDVPRDVQEIIGKRRFVQSLKTDSASVAAPRAARLVSMWKTDINAARAKLGRITATSARDPGLAEALFWKEALASPGLSDQGREDTLWHVQNLADQMVEASAPKGEIGREDETSWDELPGHAAAGRFHGLATGRITMTADHLEPWLATLQHDTPKTRAGRKRHIIMMAEEFATLDLVTRKAVRRWCLRQLQEGGKARSSVVRLVSDLRVYWAYLQDIEAVSDERQPFDNLSLSASNGAQKRASPGSERQPFSPENVVLLLRAAQDKGDHDLADLIRLAMFTGARIEELASLRVGEVQVLGQGTATIKITEAKTAAGWRDIPVPSALFPTVERLLSSSTDGFLLPGQKADKLGDRSSTIGGRFSRLKRRMGYDRRYVFHSIRKTFITELERAEVPEGVVADLVGHKKRTMTYGLYSGGTSMEAKREAVEKLAYPGV